MVVRLTDDGQVSQQGEKLDGRDNEWKWSLRVVTAPLRPTVGRLAVALPRHLTRYRLGIITNEALDNACTPVNTILDYARNITVVFADVLKQICAWI